jgi:hypothetical protein
MCHAISLHVFVYVSVVLLFLLCIGVIAFSVLFTGCVNVSIVHLHTCLHVILYVVYFLFIC